MSITLHCFVLKSSIWFIFMYAWIFLMISYFLILFLILKHWFMFCISPYLNFLATSIWGLPFLLFLAKDHFLTCLEIFDCNSYIVHFNLLKPGDLRRCFHLEGIHFYFYWQAKGTTTLGSLHAFSRIQELLQEFPAWQSTPLLALSLLVVALVWSTRNLTCASCSGPHFLACGLKMVFLSGILHF